jgi:hypothetical protein
MKIKNSVKKIGAVAGTALMAGISLGAAGSLADFPDPFVDGDGDVQSQIVVGTDGHVADVVGAVNIGAALGQAAVQTTEETVGGATAEVDGFSGETDIRGGLHDNQEVFLGYRDYDGFERVELGDQRVTPSLTVNAGEVYTEVNETDVVTYVEQDALTYTVTYGSGYEAGDSLMVLGEEYTLTEVDPGGEEIRLGSQEEHRNLASGDTVEHGPWSFEIIDVDRSEDRVRIDVYENGEFVTSATLDSDTHADVDGPATFGDDDEFQISVDDIWFGDNPDQVHMDTVYSDMTVEDGEPSPFDEDWRAHLHVDDEGAEPVIYQLDLTNILYTVDDPEDDEEIAALNEGDAFAGPADHFSLTYTELLNTAEDDQEAIDSTADEDDGSIEISFADRNGNSQTIDPAALNDGSAIGDGEEVVVGVSERFGDGYLPIDVSVEEEGGERTVTLSYDEADET